MITALTIVVSLLLVCILYLYLAYLLYKYSRRFIKIEQERDLNSYQLDVLNELLSKNKSELTIESLLDTLISSLQLYVDYDVASYLLIKKDRYCFKSFVKNSVGAHYVRKVEHLSFDYFIKYFKGFVKIKDKPLEEYISGHVLTADKSKEPISFFRIPVKYRGKQVGVLIISSTKPGVDYTQPKTYVNDILKSSTFFLQKIQNLTGVGVIRDGYVNGLVHDLRTPLVVVSGTSDLLIKREAKLKKSERIDMYKEVKRSAKRALSIINNLLDIAKIESGKVEVNSSVNSLSSFIKEEAESFRGLVEDSGLKYSIKMPNKNVDAYFDNELSGRILDNLISNAIKYTNEGSITIELKKQKDQALITVKDTGIGIKKQELPLLFNKFEQIANPVSKDYKSTGLGLVIAKELAKAQGGDVQVSSKPGEGSEFSFTVKLTS